MKKANESAAKWLTDKVKSNPKLNPIPYPFFKSIINKQIERAAKRGVALNFTELAEAVRTELLKAGIYTMSGNGKQSQPAKSSHENLSDTGEKFLPLLIHFNSAGEATSAIVIFDWLHRVLVKAQATHSSGVELSARIDKEAEHHA